MRKAAEERQAKDKADADARLIQTAVRALATEAGILDLDALALADLSTVTVNAAGKVTGARELIEALRIAKPYLFEAVKAASTSWAGPVPRPSR